MYDITISKFKIIQLAIDGKLNNIFAEIYNNQSGVFTNYQYYTTYFSGGNNDDTHYYKKKSNAAVEVSTQAYIPTNHLQSKNLDDSLSTESHYYKFNKLNATVTINTITKPSFNLLLKLEKTN